MRTTNKTKGFAFVEMTMVVSIIICLIAAMAIPAFHKIKISALAKRASSGYTLSDSEQEFLKNNASKIPTELLPDLSREFGGTKDQIYIAPQTLRFDQTIILNGKTYGLVPLN